MPIMLPPLPPIPVTPPQYRGAPADQRVVLWYHCDADKLERMRALVEEIADGQVHEQARQSIRQKLRMLRAQKTSKVLQAKAEELESMLEAEATPERVPMMRLMARALSVCVQRVTIGGQEQRWPSSEVEAENMVRHLGEHVCGSAIGMIVGGMFDEEWLGN